MPKPVSADEPSVAGKKRGRKEMSTGGTKEVPARAGAGAPAAVDASAATAPVAASSALTGAAVKHRVLVFGSRGMTARYRHLMNDFRMLIPYHKKDAKLDAKDVLTVVNEIAEAKSCDTVLYFDTRKRRDLYLWLAHAPAGPSIKFHVVNVHTMDELRMTGNCLKASRPLLSFDASFNDVDTMPHLRLVREMLCHAFAVPRGHPKTQPFHDHILNFGFADGKIWMRHYQLVDRTTDAAAAAKMLAAGEQPLVLVEIGPRCVLDIIRVFAGSFGGPTLWQNPAYVPPNAMRRAAHMARAAKYTSRVTAVNERKAREEKMVLPTDEVEEVFRKEGGASDEL